MDSGEITEGPKLSWYGEYMAAYQALKKAKDYPKIKLAIYTDHETLSHLFKYITKCTETQFINLGRVNGLPLLSAIRKLEQGREFLNKHHMVQSPLGSPHSEMQSLTI
jgi:ribonuclease HI